jgi:hypothetical protein
LKGLGKVVIDTRPAENARGGQIVPIVSPFAECIGGL